MCHTNRKKSLRSLARERSKERIAAAAHGGGVVVPDVAFDGVDRRRRREGLYGRRRRQLGSNRKSARTEPSPSSAETAS